MTDFHFGKTTARKGAVSFLFTDYFDAKNLPTPPPAFGHYRKIQNFYVLGNLDYGCCVWSGAAHEHMIWSIEGGRPRARFTARDTLWDYAAATGFDISKTDANGNNPTDQGTDMDEAAKYRRKNGIIDATGARRKIDGYLSLETGNWDQLIAAMYLFGAAGIGLQLPKSALDQFDDRRPWTAPLFPWSRPKIVGGHYVCGVGRDTNGYVPIVSWGRLNPMTRRFYERFSDEALVYFSLESLNEKGLSPEGYDADELRKHMRNLS